MSTTMTTTQASQLAWRVRKLHRRGHLTHADLALADALIWAARKPGAACAAISYSALSRLAAIARSTVAAGLRRMERLGLLRRLKCRVRVLWGQGGQASRQGVNRYELQLANTEFDGRPVVVKPQESILLVQQSASVVGTAQAILARIAAERTKLLWNAKRAPLSKGATT